MRLFQAVVLSMTVFIGLSAHAHTQPSPVPQMPSPHPQPDGNQPPPTILSAAHALEASDLEAFFDGIIPLQLERSDIAGASVLVMKDGNVLLKKGYGYADLKTKKPVDPETSIFRLASISKLFTWVSIMQLQEQGKLDIDTDINHYLDFQIRPAFGKSITLRNLMTHTGGFEEEDRDLIVINSKKDIPLRQFLVENQPRRMYPPGIIPAYSNYGVGLASYIVQRVSGKPYEQYVAEHIFAPLGMTHSTFYQPPRDTLAKLPSTGYHGNTEKPPVGFEIVHPAGAGALSSTASDMGRFGTALLNGGELDGKRILRPETLAAMWMPQFRANDQMPPICMGFYQTWRNQLRWIGHEGDLIAFHSLFFLEPSKKLILFVSYNSAGGGDKPRPEIINMFTDRYYPGDNKQIFLTLPHSDLTAIEGTYQTTRRADSTMLALGNLFSQRRATVDKDGVLRITDIKDLRDHTVKWKPIGKDLWQEIDGQRRLFTIRDGQGRIIRLAYDFPGIQSQRVPWHENSRFVLPLAGGSLAILAAVVLASLIRLFQRIFLRKRPRPEPGPGTIRLHLTSRLAAWFWVVMLLAIFIFFAGAGDDLLPPTSAWDKYFHLVNAVIFLAIILSLFSVISGLSIWKWKELRRITKVKFSLVALTCAVLSWLAIHYNLTGPATRY